MAINFKKYVFVVIVALAATTVLFSQNFELKDRSPGDQVLSLTKEQYASYRTNLTVQYPVYIQVASMYLNLAEDYTSTWSYNKTTNQLISKEAGYNMWQYQAQVPAAVRDGTLVSTARVMGKQINANGGTILSYVLKEDTLVMVSVYNQNIPQYGLKTYEYDTDEYTVLVMTSDTAVFNVTMVYKLAYFMNQDG
jgi:hypothetical protein